MEAQNKVIEESSSEETNNKKKSAIVVRTYPAIFKVEWFPITTSPWITSLAFIFYVFFFIHLIDFYSENLKVIDPQSTSINLVGSFITENLLWISYILNPLLSILSILTLFFSTPQGQGIKYILGWIGSKLLPILRYMIEINLVIAALFFIRSPYLAPLFILAATVNILVTFLGQNYTHRKDYLCCKSLQFLMIFKSIIILGYTVNCIAYFTINQESESLMTIFCGIHLLFAFLLFMCFFFFGYNIYRHSITQILQISIVNLYLGLSIGNLHDLLIISLTGFHVENRNLITSCIFFVAFTVLSYSLWTSLRKNGTNQSQQNFKKKVFFLYNKLEMSSQSTNDDCQIRGIIEHHLSQKCDNGGCFSNMNKTKFYDSKKNKYVHCDKINQGKGSFVKFILKCLYQKELDKSKWFDTSLVLEYVQFYYMKLKNVFKTMMIIEEIQKRILTPYQRLRLVRIKRIMRQENEAINKELYHGNLDFENLVAAQQKFEQIQKNLRQILNKNIEFWSYVERKQINLSMLAKILKPNMNSVQKINNNWKQIAKYFETQKIWKFYFIWYTLYVKNQKLKPHFIQQFGTSVNWDDIFLSQGHHIDRTSESGKIFLSKIMFQKQTCCIHIGNQQQRPIIKSVSQYFYKNFKYTSGEILESSLDILMTPTLKKIHHQKLSQWAGEGRSNSQTNYIVKKVFPVDKNLYIIPVFKFYKQFQSVGQQLQYIALMKRNQAEQNVVILNQRYEIQGMTQTCAQRLQIKTQEYQDVIGINWLLFMPNLISQQGNYKKLSDQLDKKMKESKSFSKSSFFEPSGRSKSIQMDYSQMQLNKSNISLLIPKNFDKVKWYYKQKVHRFENDISQFNNVIEEGIDLLRNLQYQKYNTEIELKYIKFSEDVAHYELYIRQIEQIDEKRQVRQTKFIKQQIEDEQKTQKNKQINSNCQIMDDQFNSFFQQTQQNQAISLSFHNNIFIKEENNQPVEMISYVNSVSYTIRFIFAMMTALILGGYLFQRANFDQYIQFTEQMYQMVRFQIQAFQINHKLHSQILGIPGYSISLQDLSQNLIETRNTLSFRKAILNRQINDQVYYRYNDQSRVYDHIDLIDSLIKNIIEIKFRGVQNINKNSNNFDQYARLIIPALEQMTLTSIRNISTLYTRIYDLIQIKSYIAYSVCVVFTIISFVILLMKLIKISKSLICIMEIFTQLNQLDVKNVKRYCKSTLLSFEHLSSKYERLKMFNIEQNSNLIPTLQKKLKQQSLSQNNSDSNKFSQQILTKYDHTIKEGGDQVNNTNLNKKVKTVQVGSHITIIKRQSIFLVIFLLSVYSIVMVGMSLYAHLNNRSVFQYLQSGQDLFEIFPIINVISFKYKDRAIYQQSFDLDRYEVYEQRLRIMKKMKKDDNINRSQKYYIQYNNIIFSDLCSLNTEMIKLRNYTTSQCLNITQSSLERGIQSYLFYLDLKVKQILESSSYRLSQNLEKTLQQGVQVSNNGFLYLAKVWFEGLKQQTDLINLINYIVLGIIVFIQIMIYVFIVEIWLIGNLKNNYIFFRKIYESMMPDFIVTKQKIIKAKLEVRGIIKK